MSRIRLVVLVGMIVVGLVLGYQNNWWQKEVEHAHYHAGFLVYMDGVKQDFSDFKYMNFTPCSVHDEKKSTAEEQIEKAHLHDSVGDVVHVHREGATWGDLFKNINYKFPAEKGLVGYVDGVEINDILHAPIVANSSLLLVVGDTNGVDLTQKISLEHIKEIEAKSELCGAN